jgi:hypothetical protein
VHSDRLALAFSPPDDATKVACENRTSRTKLEADLGYMLLIVEPTGQRRERTKDEGRQLYDRMLEFTADLKSRGVLKIGQSLRDNVDGVRVEVRQGKRALLDGPFSEAKEMVGGFFLLDCATREEAIAIASECPAAQWATVEVRELGPCFE